MRPEEGHGGVVDQDVDRPEPRPRRRDEPLAVLVGGEVDLDRERRAPRGLDVGDGPLERPASGCAPSLQRARAADDLRALGGEHPGDVGADAAAGARDECDLALERSHAAYPSARARAAPGARRQCRPRPVARATERAGDGRSTFASAMAWDFSTEPAFQEHLDWMREFVRDEIWPIETILDELSREQLARLIGPLQEEVKERGLWAAHLPPELGGQGYGQVKLALMHEILGTCMLAPTVFGNQAPDSGNSEILALAGTPEQKQRFLEPLLAGELRSAFSMTEPDLGRLRPDAAAHARQPRRRRVRHQRAQVVHLERLAGGLPDRDGGHRPRRAASRAGDDVRRAGGHARREHPARRRDDGGSVRPRRRRTGATPRSSTRTSASAGACALGAEGEGFKIAQQRLGPGRIHHCMRFLGMSRRAFDMLCERVTYRVSHGKPLAEHQTVQNWIADSAAQMHAARLMTLHAAWIMDTRGAAAARREISMIKFFGAEALNDVVDRALQAHGSLGYSTDMPLEAMFRSARGTRFYDGADELHRSVLARLILRDYEPPSDGVPTEHVPTRRAAARRKFADLLDPVTVTD